MNTHNMFSWRNKKNINTFGQKKKHLIKSYAVWLKKVPYLDLCHIFRIIITQYHNLTYRGLSARLS